MTKTLLNKANESIMNTYSRYNLTFESGEGCYLFDIEGNSYLDFVSGIAVNSLGYKNETLTNAIKSQADKLIHCSNLYWNKPQIELADILLANSCFDKVFYCNSGAEAVESGLKLARKYGKKHLDGGYEIITMKKSFHGRTYGALSATGQPKYQQDLDPILGGIKYADFNDSVSVESLITKDTCAILLEPIQGEGGIIPATKEFLHDLRKLCDKHNLLLIFDEVQAGIGRTGKLFAYENFNVEPDIVCLAKGLGGGFPIGAILAKNFAAKSFEPGDHASTFGGNPLACAAAKAVLEELLENCVLQNAFNQGTYLRHKLEMLSQKHPNIIETIRGVGLMQGLVLKKPVKPIISGCLEEKLLIISAGENVLRFIPSLIVEKQHIDRAVDIVDKVLNEVYR